MNSSKKKPFPLLFFLLIHFHGTYGQENPTSFQHLSIENGLTSNHINCVLQDKNGFIWIGTNEGLNKFNGYSLKTFRNIEDDSLSLASNFITCGYKDSKNRLWFGGDFLCYCNPDVEKFTNFNFIEGDKTGINSQYINAIVEDDAGVIWVGTRNGLCAFNEATKKFATFLQDTSVIKTSVDARNFITGLVADKYGVLWVATMHGLHQFNTKTKKFVVPAPQDSTLAALANLDINSFCLDNSRNIWIAAADSNLFYFNRQQKYLQKINYNLYCDKSLSFIIGNINCDKSGKIWLASGFNGIIVLNPETNEWKKYQHDMFDAKSLVDDKTQCVFEGVSGLIWIGTHRGGVDRIQPYPDKFHSYVLQPGKPASLCNNDITIGLEDSKGNLWLGAKEGMMYFDRITNAFTCFKHEALNENSLSSNTIYTITKDSGDNLWIGTNKGFNYFNIKTKRWKHYFQIKNDINALPGVEVFDSYVRKDGTVLAGTNGSVCLFNPATETFTTRFNNENINHLRRNNYITTFEHSDGTLWLSTSSTGILHVTSSFQVIDSFFLSGGFNAASVHQFVEDTKRNVWMATTKGLYRWNNSTSNFTVFNSAELGLSGDIKSVVAENEKSVWISTVTGISQLVFKSESEIEFVKKFDESDGLQGNTFNNFAGIKLNSGELFFGGINGFNLFNPASIHYNKFIPQVRIIAFKVFDKELQFDKEIDSIVQINLSYGQNFFTFEMGALSFDHPEKNQFGYQLVGFDKEMIYTGTNHIASYTNIPPGNYVLHIIASNNDGVWNTEGIRINLSIVPPFWKTNWFQIIVFTLLCLAAYGLYYLRIKKIKNDEKIKSEINKQIAEARLTALSAQMNPHFIFNSLNSIQQFISESEKENALKYLSKFSKLIRLVLQNANKNSTTIRNEVSMLEFYLELESLRFSNKFSYQITVDDRINKDGIEIPSMVLQPYVENAIIHGLLNKTTNGNLEIKISQINNSIICVIEDNGIGRAEAATIKNRKLIGHESLGMKMTAERVLMLERLTNKKVKIAVHDLKDEKENAAGTRVEIEIDIEEFI
ncbi:MAG: histidine kinase [Bacteroidetes bacterium]|nr:histidine kinase [Bacteroidota bacterium]